MNIQSPTPHPSSSTGSRLHMDWITNGNPHSGYIDMDWLKDNNYSKESLSVSNAAIEPTVGVCLSHSFFYSLLY